MVIHPKIREWQSTHQETGMVIFAESQDALRGFPHRIATSFIPLGMVEADLLCVNDSTGELVLLDHEVAGRIHCPCAASQEHFIAALQILEDYFNRCVESEAVYRDEAAGLEAIAKAVEAAGGKKYKPMYHSLVGF